MHPVEPDRFMQRKLCELLPRMRRFARSLAGTAHDADDLVQTAIERALARSAQWKPDQGMEGWVFGIIRNAWLDEVRARQRRQLLFAPEEDGDQARAPSMDQVTGLSVEAAMAALPENQRAVVALVLIEGLSYRDAAVALEVPVGTVTSRLSRARESLQNMLGEEPS